MRANTQLSGLDSQRTDILIKKFVPSALQERGSGTGCNKHSYSPLLVQDALIHEPVNALGGGGRVDAVESGKLVGLWDLRLFGERSLDNLVLDLFGYLQEDGPTVVDHRGPPVDQLSGQLVSYLCN